jgi:hypothetical protein
MIYQTTTDSLICYSIATSLTPYVTPTCLTITGSAAGKIHSSSVSQQNESRFKEVLIIIPEDKTLRLLELSIMLINWWYSNILV